MSAPYASSVLSCRPSIAFQYRRLDMHSIRSSTSNARADIKAKTSKADATRPCKMQIAQRKGNAAQKPCTATRIALGASQRARRVRTTLTNLLPPVNIALSTPSAQSAYRPAYRTFASPSAGIRHALLRRSRCFAYVPGRRAYSPAKDANGSTMPTCRSCCRRENQYARMLL